jgi:hypothetical protein
MIIIMGGCGVSGGGTWEVEEPEQEHGKCRNLNRNMGSGGTSAGT